MSKGGANPCATDHHRCEDMDTKGTFLRFHGVTVFGNGNIALLVSFMELWNPGAIFFRSQGTNTNSDRIFGAAAILLNPWPMQLFPRSSRAWVGNIWANGTGIPPPWCRTWRFSMGDAKACGLGVCDSGTLELGGAFKVLAEKALVET